MTRRVAKAIAMGRMDRAPASASPSSASVCPACGKAIDPLRAGQVAILDGSFRYFCDATCKVAFMEVASKRQALDARTADPPAVAPISAERERRREAPSAPSTSDGGADVPLQGEAPDSEGEDEPEPEDESQGEDQGRDHAKSEDVDGGTGTESDTRVDAPAAPEPDAVPAPSTLRSPAVALPASPTSSLAARAIAIAPGIGIASGVLAAAVGLAGDAASVARVPLAALAAAVLAAQVALRPRERSEASPWLVAVPVLVATVVAAVTRGEAHGVFAGLAAAAALLVDQLVTRARRDVVGARARTLAALAVRARVVRGDAVTEVDASEVKPGDQVLVEAGETIAVDGIVAAGGGEVAPWTDSPVALEKREGDPVVAGATVVTGRLRVAATFTGAERAWLRLSQGRDSRVDVAAPLVVLAQRAVERGVPLAALVVAGAAYANNGALPDVIVAACGGAYAAAALAAVSAIAIAHARGHLAAQRRGIVYKDAEAFDAAGRADVAVVCSRGTVLLGEPEIVVIEALGGKSAAEDVARVLSLAAGAEMASSHPFAAAILRAARARNVRPENVRSALKHSGLGVTALAPNGDKVIVGSRAFLLQEKVSVALADARVSELEAEGRSVLLVALGGRLAGLLALQDGLRPGARAAVQRLHDASIEPVLLSGEARDTCETIARSLDIEHVRPEILPADRGAELRALADGGHVVAAIGHAASDDGALGAAGVSVAMGAAGSAPGEWSVALASDDVRDAALALTVPRACRERAKAAALVGAAAQGLSALVIAFGVASPSVAPVVAVLAAATALTLVREPTVSRRA